MNTAAASMQYAQAFHQQINKWKLTIGSCSPSNQRTWDEIPCWIEINTVKKRKKKDEFMILFNLKFYRNFSEKTTENFLKFTEMFPLKKQWIALASRLSVGFQ